MVTVYIAGAVLQLVLLALAGNNWAHGHHGYGPQYREALLQQLQHAAEEADSLQGFLLLHSLGGGTGSGLGTYLLGLMEVGVCGERPGSTARVP